MSKISSSVRSVRRASVAMAASAVMAVSLLGGAPAATAQTQPANPVEQLSSQLSSAGSAFSIGNLTKGSRDQAWTTRNQLLQSLRNMNPQAEAAIRPTLDAVIEAFFPGLKAQKLEEARKAREEAARRLAAERAREEALAREAARKAEAERKRNAFNPGPCPRDARVCVDIDGRRTWLQGANGEVTYVAPAMAPGKPGQETPRGTFSVTRKVKDEVSYIYNMAPMPWAVYFTWNGHAFHQGDPSYMSAGCVRLTPEAAQKYFETLQVGDKVFIY